MNTDKYTIQGSRIENVILSLCNSGGISLFDSIAILAAVEAAANERPVDGTAWIEGCQAMLKENAQ